MKAFTYLHILGAIIALAAGYAALLAPKGKWLHRNAGLLFVYAMVAMGVGAAVAGSAHERESWSGGITAAYFAITAATAVRRRPHESNLLFDGTLLLIPIGFGVWRLIAGVQVMFMPGGKTPEGVPALMVLLSAVLLLFAAAGDIHVLRHGPLTGTPRLKRHLWRMGYAMFSATGAFFIGQPRFVPALLSGGLTRVILAVLPLIVMFYWLARAGRHRTRAASETPRAYYWGNVHSRS
ncbi:MAG TPA: hypothetical protein VEB19_08100 [Gemmatimonadaceae bacterium]|nr:hypothetical protein [Gemmatimonadaceae bacterium]